MPLFPSAFARTTLTLLIASAIALLAIVGTSLWLVERTGTHSAEVARAQELRLRAFRVLGLLQDAETGQRGYLLTGEAAYLEPYDRAKDQIRTDLARLREAAGAADTGAERIDRLTALVDDKFAELAETVALTAAGRTDEALTIVRSDRGKALMDEARTVVSAIIADSDARLNARLADLQWSALLLRWVSMGGGLLIIVFAAGCTFTVMRHTRALAVARHQVDALNADLENRVRERTADLERANEEIQRFAYIVSHDLRAPLVNVMGFTSELETGLAALQRYLDAAPAPEDPALAEEAQAAVREEFPEAIRFIRSSTGKMDRLINAILKLSREGRRRLTPQRIDLGALIETAAAAIRHQLDAAGATLTASRTFPVVISDKLALEQVFGNLIDNAVKYLDPARPGLIAVRARREGSRIVVEIEDNGRGIGAQDHERIFELFRRSGAQDMPGEGIGLAHVKSLVRRLGGEISVRSELGRGTTFQVSLPGTLRTA